MIYSPESTLRMDLLAFAHSGGGGGGGGGVFPIIATGARLDKLHFF